METLSFNFNTTSFTIYHNTVFNYDNETEDKNDDVTTESSKIYHFEVNKAGQLKFKSISLAG